MKEYDLFFEEKKLAFKNRLDFFYFNLKFFFSKFQMLAISAELVKDTGNENLSNKQVRSTLLRLLQVNFLYKIVYIFLPRFHYGAINATCLFLVEILVQCLAKFLRNWKIFPASY